jgi:phosphate-selective porin OprO/OprP
MNGRVVGFLVAAFTVGIFSVDAGECGAQHVQGSLKPQRLPPAPDRILSANNEQTTAPRVGHTAFNQRDLPAPDYRELMRRLETAEAEIHALREQQIRGVEVSVTSTMSDSTAAAIERLPSVEDNVAQIQKEWHDYKASLTQPKFPNLTVSGVFQADAGVFSQDAPSRATVGSLQDGADFRRARLAAKGSVNPTTNYFFQMDFAFFGRPTFTDVWVEFTDLPTLGTVRIGQWKQPFSLEVVSSFRYTTFMERSLLFQSLDPFRHIGIGFYDHSDDLSTTWALSAIRTGQDQFGGSISTNGGDGIVGRVTNVPWYDEDSGGRGYLHLGAGYYFNSPPRDAVRFRTVPEIFIGEVAASPIIGTSGQPVPGAQDGTPFFIDTGALGAKDVNTFGAEMLLVTGPFSLQSEVAIAVVNQTSGIAGTRNLGGGPTAALPGGYVQIGYFLTGEHRPYDRVAGAIDRVKPFEDFFLVRTCEGGRGGGLGAWELAARYSYLDLNDANIRGGTLSDVTFGVNWYANAYTKLVANYIHSSLNHPTFGSSDTSVFAVRAQVDF